MEALFVFSYLEAKCCKVFECISHGCEVNGISQIYYLEIRNSTNLLIENILPMCNRVTEKEKELRDIVRYYDLSGKDLERKSKLYKPGYVISGFVKKGEPRPRLPIIRPMEETVDIDMYEWGLVPHWVTDRESWKASTLNARNDELFQKPSYRSYWKNRCLVVVSGFFEPRDRKIAGLPGRASKVQETESWYIHHAEEPLMTMGGIYCNDTVTIITTDVSPMMAEIHNDGLRMPLIFDSDELRDRWLLEDLTQKQMAEIMDTHPDDSRLEAYRTIDGIFNSRVNTNTPDALLPHPEPDHYERA